jgi:spore coat polysaccharide biosynthesis protein SpsF (cytidylyltransferase family)
MKNVAVLQARMTSSRLPGKVLRPILGQPMLALQIERIRRAKLIHHLVVATSTDASDTPVADLCARLGVEAYRGSLDDVLDRMYRAAAPHAPTHLVRLTGDCPLTDPTVIDLIIRSHVEHDADYSSNTQPPSFPHGLDAEVARWTAFECVHREARLPSEREHVTPYLYRHPELFRLNPVIADVDRSSMRWTVDHPSDFDLVARVYGALYPGNAAFTTEDVLRLFEREPDLATINAGLSRHEGMQRSLRADAEARHRGGGA